MEKQMSNRTFLPLIEQIIMILVFAIISSVCVGCFTIARSISIETEMKDDAVFLAQNIAEELKQKKSLSQKAVMQYDENLNLTDTDAEYTVIILPEEDNDSFLENAKIQVLHGNNVLFELPVSWQEGLHHE